MTLFSASSIENGSAPHFLILMVEGPATALF